MKKLIAIAVVVLVITVFVMVGSVGAKGPPDASERTVYETAIVPTGWGTDSLDEGEVKVFADGSVMVKIEGAEPDETYYVFFGWQDGLPEAYWQTTWDLTIGPLFTDGDGNGEFSLPEGSISGPVIAPVFAINRPELTLTQFVSGF